jgi:hypothetical protein
MGGPMSPDNVYETGVSPRGRMGSRSWAPGPSRSSELEEKTWSRARSEFFVPYRPPTRSRSKLSVDQVRGRARRRDERSVRADGNEGPVRRRTEWNFLSAKRGVGPGCRSLLVVAGERRRRQLHPVAGRSRHVARAPLQQSRRLGVDRDAEEAKRQDRLRVAEGHGALRGTG